MCHEEQQRYPNSFERVNKLHKPEVFDEKISKVNPAQK